MKIKRELCDEIFTKVGELPPEIGGILGGIKDDVMVVEFDKCEIRQRRCSYTPNVNYLNTVIDFWEKEKIKFLGIFHSHYFGVKSLSEGDQKYIYTIMRNMPDDIPKLYFPIVVMPDKEIVVYKAHRCQDDVIIEKEILELV